MGCTQSDRYTDYEVYHPYEEVIFTQAETVNIDRYLHHLYNHVKMRVPLEEVRHIREGVESFVRKMLDVIAETDIRFHVERHGLIHVGSFVEGSKLKTPDDFNFIAVLSELDSDDLILDDPNHQENGLPVKLRVREQKDQTFRQNWKRAIVDDIFFVGKRTTKIRQNGILDKFLKQIRIYLKTFSHHKTPVGDLVIEGHSSAAAIICKSSILLKLILVRTQVIYEGFQSVEIRKSYPIYVTVTPAIRWFKVGNYLFKEDVIVPYLFTEVSKFDSFLLIPGPDGHFLKSFVEIESKAIRNISPRHRKCLTLVKYLLNGDSKLPEYKDGGASRLFTSHSLKMAMLCFVGSCPCLSGDSDYEIADCVLYILTKLHDNLHDKIHRLTLLPNAFMKATSTVDESVLKDGRLMYLNKVLLSELLKHDLKLWIGKLQKYDFDAPLPRYGVVPLYKKLTENNLYM